MKLIIFSAVADIHDGPQFIDSTQPQQNFEGTFGLIKALKLINDNNIRFYLSIQSLVKSQTEYSKVISVVQYPRQFEQNKPRIKQFSR